jgi:hypothetical protein
VPTPWSAAQNKADGLKQKPQTECSVRVPLCQDRCLLDERRPQALRRVAAETADRHIYDCLPTGDRQVAEVTLITAVERIRPGATVRALRAPRCTAHGEMHDLVGQANLLENEPGTSRQ